MDDIMESLARINVAVRYLNGEVPPPLLKVKGNRAQREAMRYAAFAELLETLVLREVDPSLPTILRGYTNLEVLKRTDIEDLVAQGVDPEVAARLKERLDANGE